MMMTTCQDQCGKWIKSCECCRAECCQSCQFSPKSTIFHPLGRPCRYSCHVMSILLPSHSYYEPQLSHQPWFHIRCSNTIVPDTSNLSIVWPKSHQQIYLPFNYASKYDLHWTLQWRGVLLDLFLALIRWIYMNFLVLLQNQDDRPPFFSFSKWSSINIWSVMELLYGGKTISIFPFPLV